MTQVTHSAHRVELEIELQGHTHTAITIAGIASTRYNMIVDTSTAFPRLVRSHGPCHHPYTVITSHTAAPTCLIQCIPTTMTIRTRLEINKNRRRPRAYSRSCPIRSSPDCTDPCRKSSAHTSERVRHRPCPFCARLPLDFEAREILLNHLKHRDGVITRGDGALGERERRERRRRPLLSPELATRILTPSCPPCFGILLLFARRGVVVARSECSAERSGGTAGCRCDITIPAPSLRTHSQLEPF